MAWPQCYDFDMLGNRVPTSLAFRVFVLVEQPLCKENKYGYHARISWTEKILLGQVEGHVEVSFVQSNRSVVFVHLSA